ncbi:hypothetical protein, partial [Rhodococcus koreensis]|uniref:hypothetical protein n=1 Tax=Rhodococcus koreensis TaxID=99653 RepID=UPI00366DE80D
GRVNVTSCQILCEPKDLVSPSTDTSTPTITSVYSGVERASDVAGHLRPRAGTHSRPAAHVEYSLFAAFFIESRTMDGEFTTSSCDTNYVARNTLYGF